MLENEGKQQKKEEPSWYYMKGHHLNVQEKEKEKGVGIEGSMRTFKEKCEQSMRLDGKRVGCR